MFHTLKIILLVLTFYPLSGQLTLNDISIPSNIKEGDYQTYSIVKSDDNTGNIYTCRWDFDDGNTKELVNGFNAGHTYMDDGSFTLNFSTEDEEGNRQEISKKVSVENVAPEIRFLDGQNADYANNKAKFQSVVYEPGKDEINYKWDFGDGKTKEGKSYDDVSHTYEEPGVYTVRLTVEDGDGGTDSETMLISVENDWYGSISGDVNGTFSGGTSILYQAKIDTVTKELVTCFKAITLFDDNNNSFFWLMSNNLIRLSNNTHSIGNNDDEFDVILRYDLMPSMYENNKTFFRSQEAMDDWTRLAGSSFRSLSLFSDMRRAAFTGENVYGEMYEDISGIVKFDPIQGDRLRGTISASLCSNCESENPENPPKYANINLNFDIWINDVAAFNMEHGCEEEPNPFSIVDHTPNNGKVNINPDDPCIEVTFSEKVDPQSVNASNIQLGYNDANDQFKIEDIAIDYSGEEKIGIIPINTLRKGVKYEVKIKNGNRGVKSIEGGELTSNENWNFSTMIVPSNIKVRVYQSVADAPLIEDKNSMVRIQVEWDKPADVSEESFVGEFPAKIILKDASGKAVGHEESFTIEHQSRFSDEDIRMAENSSNIYSWKPKPSNGNELNIEIIPEHQRCQTGNEDAKYKIAHPIQHAGIKPQIKMDYYIVKDSELSIVEEETLVKWFNYIAKNNTFSVQIYPISEIITEFKGTIEPTWLDVIFDDSGLLQANDSLEILSKEAIEEISEQIKKNNENQYAKFIVAAIDIATNSDADVSVFLSDLGHGPKGKTYGTSYVDFGKEFIMVRNVEGQFIRPTLTHELGHSFYLEHIPYVANDAEREAASNKPFKFWENDPLHEHFNGFKISPNGDFGYNKNCDEGNGESDVITSIMFPHAKNVFFKEPWIDKRQYMKALDHIKLSGKGLSFHPDHNDNGYHWASLVHNRLNKAEKLTINVSGKYDLISNEAIIISAQLGKGKIKKSDGYLVLQCLDKDGNLLGSNNFNPQETKISHDFDNNSRATPFFSSIEIPKSSSPRIIRIREKDRIIAKYNISEHKPQIKLELPAINDTIKGLTNFNWTSLDRDDDELIYLFLYSPNGMNSWQLQGITQDTFSQIDISKLKSGENPAFKIQAYDGFHKSEVLIPVHINFPFEIKTVSPIDSYDRMEGITVEFSNMIKPSNKADQWFNFFGIDRFNNNRRIPYEIEYSDDMFSIIIHPYLPLEKGMKYFISYGEKPTQDEIAALEKHNEVEKQKKPRGVRGSVKKWLAKQVDKMTTDDENSENGEFLKDILGLPNESKKEEPVEKEKKSNEVLEKMLGLPNEEQPKYFIEDIFGNTLTEYFTWSFEIK